MKMPSFVIGIDYSMTSPAFWVHNLETGNWNGYYLDQRKEVSVHMHSSSFMNIMAFPGDILEAWKKIPSSLTARYEMLASFVIDGILSDPEIKPWRNAVVGIEDYAFQSKGKVFSLAENCGILKFKLELNSFKDIKLIPAKSWKKELIGSGNADKDLVYEKFVEETKIDLHKELSLKRGKSVKSPISDLADSYFITRMLKLEVEKENKQ